MTGPVSHHFQDGLMAACAAHPQSPPTQRLLGQWQLRNWVLGRRYVDYDDSEWLQLIVLCSFRNKILHPQGDGLVENFNRTLLDMLATVTKEQPGDWDRHL